MISKLLLNYQNELYYGNSKGEVGCYDLYAKKID